MKNLIDIAIQYAYRNKMRLLLETEPNDRLFVYCDGFNVSDFAEIFKGVKPIYSTTDVFFKYDYYPKHVKLDYNKGKWQYRFYKKYNIDLVELEDKDIYFIDRNEQFLPEEKKELIDHIKKLNFKELTMDELFSITNQVKLGIPSLEKTDINMFNDFGIIFFK
jgi:hypothetical protein